MYANRRTFIKNMALAGGFAFVSFSPKNLFGAEVADIYRETISIIKKAYLREIQAHIAYTKFSQKALAEDYPNLAYLFRSFAEAESIHGRNFRNNLISLGSQAGSPEDKFEVLSTKENLGQAIDLELQEINIYYPDHLSKIKEEEHWNSIASIAHALASEKQHEDMLRKM